ncbi:hypothetical protein [Metabacillus niabensis]|uniref:hypothetical protein n=1 Tax=Metabacillus niabensis TaxID=324854 RepID=UPI0039A04411
MSNSNFNWYLKNKYNPAQDWYRNGGKNWIKQYINNYDWVIKNYDLINLGIYRVTLNNVTAYVGESVKVSNRLVVHAWHLANEPEKYYGVLPDEIKNNIVQINMECIEVGIHSKSDRKQKEFEYIKKLNPFTQMKNLNDSYISKDNKRYDSCISKVYRRNVARKILSL